MNGIKFLALFEVLQADLVLLDTAVKMLICTRIDIHKIKCFTDMRSGELLKGEWCKQLCYKLCFEGCLTYMKKMQ
jgi:hypothetical protein